MHIVIELKLPGTIKLELPHLDELHATLHSLKHQINALTEEVMNMSQDISALVAQVTASRDVENAALVLIQGIAARLEAAGTDPVAVAAEVARLKDSADSLSAAVVANTPSDPGTPVDPNNPNPSDPSNPSFRSDPTARRR